jgi:hypothetical protein
MLFDLRARGRRRTVQVVYLGLAVLIGLGLVGFGIGGGFGSSGIFNALTNKEGSSGASFGSQVSSAQRRTQHHPQEPAAWAALIDAQLHQAGSPEYTDVTGKYTSQGKALLPHISQAWQSYLALNPPHPDSELAERMASLVYGEEGLNQPSEAVQALQIVVAAKPPSAALYGALAMAAYKAKNTRQGDLASQKAVSLSPPAQRKAVKAQLEQEKKSVETSAASAALKSGSATVTPTSGGSHVPVTIKTAGTSSANTGAAK